MIFVITGTQEPFDRMIKVIDEIAENFETKHFLAQVSGSLLKPRYLETFEFIPPLEFNKYFDEAELIISHAGMGTIISALQRDKPIIIMPRLAQYGEHRNDHQIDTCKVFERLGYVNVAYNEIELKEKVVNLLTKGAQSLHKIGEYGSKDLLLSLNEFLES